MAYSTMEMANAFLKAGELDDALEALNAHLAENPSDEAVLRLRAAVYARMGGDEHQRRACQDLEAIQQRTPEDYILHSAVLDQQSKQAQALEVIHQGYETYPEHERLAEQRIVLLRKYKAFDKAMECVSLLLSRKSDSWRWQQWAGDIASESGNPSLAATHYTNALRLITDQYTIDMRRAAVVLNDATISDAAALTIMGAYARLLLARAGAYLQQNEMEKAEDDYAAAQTLLPGDFAIPFNRGLIAARRGNLKQAQALCEPALKNAPQALSTWMRQILEQDPHYTNLLTLL